MKWLIFLAMIFICKTGNAQYSPVSNEDFVNEVSKLVVDSNFSHFNLCSSEGPCSFKKFDYDEWYKYALTEDVPIYILNELAKKSFLDNAPLNWQQQKLQHAICIDAQTAKNMLDLPLKRHIKNAANSSFEDKVVFYFSRPVFTDDNQYAIIDMGYRCDDKQCGMGATFLFRQLNGKWKIAARKLVWGN